MIGFVLALLCCIGTTLAFIYSVRFYVSKQSIPMQITILSITAISFFFALSVCIMLPLDIYGDDTETYTSFWVTNYWISLVLSWIVIPLLMEFRDAPEFHVFEQIRTACRQFMATNILVMFVLLIFVVIVMSTEGLTANSMRVVLVTMSNTFGLIVIIVALGYGLVNILRNMYLKTDRKAELKSIYAHIGVCKDKIVGATTELQKLKDKLDAMQTGSMYHEYISNMLDLLPPTLIDTANNNISTSWYEELVNINKGIKIHMRDYNTYNNQMHLDIKKVIALKKDSPWNVSVRPYIYVGLLISCSLLSFIVCWSEITIPAHMTMLPNSVPLSLLMLSYMAVCTYYSYTQLYPDWRRDLLYSSMIVGRFAISIGLNYIDILYGSGEAHNVQYYNIYETFPYYSNFATYYPVCTLVFALFGAFNVIDKIKYYCGFVGTDQRDNRIALFEQEGERLVDHEHRYMMESII